MSYAKVEAGRGLGWLSEAIGLVVRNPAAFLVMGIILAAINIVPVLGGLAMTILGPAFFGGIAYAAREESAGRKAEIQHLFRAFQEPGKIGPMLLLCLPAIVGGAVILMIGLAFGISALIGGGLSAAAGSTFNWGALGGGILVLALVALVIGFFIYALQFFAIPRVMLDGAEPFAAMKESLSACLSNLPAFLLFVVVFALASIVLAFILMFIPLLGWLALITAASAVFGCATFVGYRDLYAPASLAGGTPPSPPPASTV